MAFCNWTSFDVDDESLADLLDHYTNVFIARAPPITMDTHLRLLEEPDFSRVDPYFIRLKGRAVFLIAGFQYAVRFDRPVEYMSSLWKKGYAKALHILVDHLRELGIGYEEFALYHHDEPGLFKGPIIESVYQLAKLTKEIDPNVQVYANPTGGANAENLACLGPYVDIWCPFLTLVKRDPELVRFLKETGRRVWCYEAEGNVKRLHPLGYYRAQPWIAFSYGLEGVGFWTYRYRDLWDRWAMYGMVYEGDGPVPSKRWEAYRDGVEDYNYLSLLREAIEDARSAGVSARTIREAEELLRRAVEEVTRGQEEVDEITRWVGEMSMDYELFARLRRSIAQATVSLRRQTAEVRERQDK